jgi:hypothetical protein
MRHIRTTLLALVAAMAVGGVTADAASAGRRLELSEKSTGVLASGTEITAELNFALVTPRGTIHCITAGVGPVTNGAKIDVLTATFEHASCEAPGVPEEVGSFGLSRVTMSAIGRATATLTIPIKWPPPYEGCVYKGTVHGASTTTGFLEATFAGRLIGEGCHEHAGTLTSTFWYLEGGAPFYEELEASVVEVG